MIRPLVLLLVLVGLVADEASHDLEALRQAWHARLTARMAADAAVEAPADVRISLERAVRFQGILVRTMGDRSGIDYEWMDVDLSRRGGRWLAPQVGGFSTNLAERFVLRGFDAADLTWNGHLAGGGFVFTSARFLPRDDFAHGMTLHHTPPEVMPVIPWGLGGRQRLKAIEQRVELDMPTDAPSGWSMELHIPDAVDTGWRMPSEEDLVRQADQVAEDKVARQREKQPDLTDAQAETLRQRSRDQALVDLTEKAQRSRATGSRRPVTVFLRLFAGRPVTAYALSNHFNKATHDVTADELVISDDRLRGSFTIIYRPDRWQPSGRRSLNQVYAIDLPIGDYGRFTGAYQATGDMGDFAGKMGGVVRRSRLGRYRSTGTDGPAEGRAFIETVGVPTAPPVLPSLPAAERDGECYRQVRALAQALAGYPRPLEDCLAATSLVPGRLVQDDGQPVQLRIEPTIGDGTPPATGACHPEDAWFGPWDAAPEALPVDGDAAILGPVDRAGRQTWRRVATWRVLGPLDDRPADAAWLPPIPYPFAATAGGRQWSAPLTFDEAFTVPASIQQAAKGMRAFTWLARTVLRAVAAEDVWVAVPACADGRLWVNGRLAWRGDGRADGLDRAILMLPLAKGDNEIILRASVRDLSWGGGGSISGTGPVKVGLALGGLQVCVAGAPQETPAVTTAVVPPHLGRRQPTRDAPRAWSLRTGTNVRWQCDVPTEAERPLLAGDRLFLVERSGTVTCLATGTGEELWAKRPADTALTPGATDGTDLWCLGADGSLLRLGPDGGERFRSTTDLRWDPDAKEVTLFKLELLADHLYAERVTIEDQQRIHRYDCFTADDGRHLWSAILPAKALSTGGGVVPVLLTRGPRVHPVLVTRCGRVIDGVDGRLLFEEIRGVPGTGSLPAVSPTGLVGFIGGGTDHVIGGWVCGWKAAAQLGLGDDGAVRARFLWRTKGPSRFSGPAPLATDDGLFYAAVGTTEHHQEYPCPFSNLHVYDTITGQQLQDLKPLAREHVAPKSLDLADGTLFVADEGGRQYFCPRLDAIMHTIRPGEQPVVLAVSELPVGPVEPVWGEDCLWVMGTGRLACLARVGAEGRTYELSAIAQESIARIGNRPVDPQIRMLEPRPLPSLPAADQVMFSLFRTKTQPERWLILGPFPSAVPETAWRPILMANDLQTLPTVGAGHRLGETDYIFAPSPAAATYNQRVNWMAVGNTWAYSTTWVLDLWRLLDNTGNRRVLLSAVITVDRPGIYQLKIGSTQTTRVFLAGEELADGNLVRLQEGSYALGLALAVEDMPAWMKQMKLTGDIGFYPVKTGAQLQREWFERAQPYRPVLEEVLAGLPQDHPAAARARLFLRAMQEVEQRNRP